MRAVSFTEARSGLKSVLDHVIEGADTTVITRRDAEYAADKRLPRRIHACPA